MWFLYAANQKDGNEKGKNGVRLNHGGEDDGFTVLVRFLGNDRAAGSSRFTLIDGRNITGNGNGQTGAKKSQALSSGEIRGQFVHDHERGKEAVEALGTGENLENKDFTELARVFRNDTGSGLTNDTNTSSRTCTGESSCKSSTENS